MHYPANKEALRQVIMSARESGTGLVAQSSEEPHFHCASENATAETVNFGRMNAIKAVNRHDRYIRVEAGVTFGQLLSEVKAAGMRLNMPFLPRAGKSVLTAALERSEVMLPKYQYDYTDPLLNLEVVLGTGDEFRTGSAAGPGPVEELKSDMVTPWGPGSIDYLRFFSGAQGTMGFATWGTMKSELMPKMTELYFVENDNVAELCALSAELLKFRVPEECFIISAAALAAAFCDSAAEAETVMPKLAPWTLICRIAGFERYPEERIEIYRGYLENYCTDAGLSTVSKLPVVGLAERIDTMLGDCDRRSENWKLRRGCVKELDFLSPVSKAAELTLMLDAELDEFAVQDKAIIVFPQVQGRAFRVECSLFHTKVERHNAENAIYKAAERLANAGAYFDRPYGKLAELVYGADTESTETLRSLKKIFDPDGILNPGKLCF